MVGGLRFQGLASTNKAELATNVQFFEIDALSRCAISFFGPRNLAVDRRFIQGPLIKPVRFTAGGAFDESLAVSARAKFNHF